MRGARTATGPRPVMILRSGRWPWRTSRWRPSSVCLSAWPLRKAATSASTACANRARAPSRRTSVSGSEKASGWISLTTLLSWVTACHSFGGEVEVSNTPTIRRLIPHAVTNFRAYLPAGRRQVLAQGLRFSVEDENQQHLHVAMARHNTSAGSNAAVDGRLHTVPLDQEPDVVDSLLDRHRVQRHDKPHPVGTERGLRFRK